MKGKERVMRGGLAVLLALCMLAVPACAAAQCSLIIEPQELAKMLSERPEIRFIDLRSEKEYNQMHIAGFQLLEYDEQAILALAEEESPVVFICSRGVRSAMAYNLMLGMGKKDVHACIFGVADYAEAMGEEKMEGGNICLPCLIKARKEEE